MAKRSSKIEPLDIDEMFNSPSLEGMLSFREVKPLTAAERLRSRTTLDNAEPAATLTGPQDTPAPFAITPPGLTPIGFTPTLPSPASPQQRPEVMLSGPTSDEGPSEADILAELHDSPKPPVTRGKASPGIKRRRRPLK